MDDPRKESAWDSALGDVCIWLRDVFRILPICATRVVAAAGLSDVRLCRKTTMSAMISMSLGTAISVLTES